MLPNPNEIFLVPKLYRKNKIILNYWQSPTWRHKHLTDFPGSWMKVLKRSEIELNGQMHCSSKQCFETEVDVFLAESCRTETLWGLLLSAESTVSGLLWPNKLTIKQFWDMYQKLKYFSNLLSFFKNYTQNISVGKL